MHDLQLGELRGWPDLTTAASISVCVKQSKQIAIPAGDTGNWDCVMQLQPIISECNTTLWDRTDDLFLQPSSPACTQKMALLTIKSYSGAKAGGPYGVTTVPSQDQVIALPPAYTKGKGRLIGVGFEVNNTTAELYKQGTVTVYRMPQMDMDSKTRRVSYSTPLSLDKKSAAPSEILGTLGVATQEVTFQPTTLPAAMLLAGTRQWEAKEGCYVVGGFNDTQNLVLPAEYRQPVLYSSISDDVAGSPNTTDICLADNSSTPAPPDGLTYWIPQKWAPINSGGAIFTGLSQQTTLTVTVNLFYEAFPTAAEPEYAVLAKPSAEFDPMAMAMVTRAMESMPVGVRAADNGFGDWFAGLVSDFAPMIGNALNTIIPGAGVLGTGAKFLADRYLASNSANVKTPSRVGRAQPVNKGGKLLIKQKADQGSKARPFKVPSKNPPKWWKGPRKSGTTALHEGKWYVLV